MVAITGTLKNSNNELLNGELWILLDAPLKDTSTNPDSILLPVLRKLTIANGALSLNLPESESQQVSYWFRFFEYEGNTTTVKVLPTMEFRSFVPNTTAVEFDDLIPVNISIDTIGINAAQIAQILANNPQYAEILRGDPRFVGDYSATRLYQRGEAARYGGTWWMWFVRSQQLGIEPSIEPPGSNYWIPISQKGDPGGTGGQNTAYGPGWNGATWAPSANALYAIINTLATAASLASYAPLNNAVMTGDPGRNSDLAANSNANLFATAKWVRSLFALLDSPVFINNPSAPTQALTDNSNKLATTKFVKDVVADYSAGALIVASQSANIAIANATWTTIPFDTESHDPGNIFVPTTGFFAPPVTGWHEISVSAYFSAGSAITQAQFSLWDGSGEIGAFYLLPHAGNNTLLVQTRGLFLLTQGTSYRIRFYGSTNTLIGTNALIPTRLFVRRLTQ